MKGALAAMLLAGGAAAQAPDPSPAVAGYVRCVEAWATSRAPSSATAFEIADAAVDACPGNRQAALRLAEPDPEIDRVRAYARARALIAVIDARLPKRP